MWLAVDAVERPDLIEKLSDLIKSECSSCGGPLRRSQPLLMLRLARAASLIAARGSDDELDPLERLGEIIDIVKYELGDDIRDVSGPALIVTFDELTSGTRQDIDRDIATLLTIGKKVFEDSSYLRLLNKIAANRERQRIVIGLERLEHAETEIQFRKAIQECPELATREADGFISERLSGATTEHELRNLSSVQEMIHLVQQGDLAGAWSVRNSDYKRFIDEIFTPRLMAFEEAMRGTDWSDKAKAGLNLLEILPPEHYLELQARVAAETVVALLRNRDEDWANNIERAIELGRYVISILDAHPEFDNPRLRFLVLTNLSSAFEMRFRGDPTWNYTQGIELLTSGLDRYPEGIDLDIWTMVHNNLGLLKLNRGLSEGFKDYDEAREHLELALTHRSPKQDPRGWAYTQLNLAVTYSRSQSGDHRTNLGRATAHSAKARNAACSIANPSMDDDILLAQAEHNLAADQYRLSQIDSTTHTDRIKLLDHAEGSATESLRISSRVELPLQQGRAWLTLGQIRLAKSDKSGAIDALKSALSLLSPGIGAAEVREASRLLLQLAEEQGNVELAADAAEQLYKATTAAIFARSRTVDRISEYNKSSTDFRFAAYALLHADRLEEALLAIESGRARELGLLLLTERLDLDRLSHFNPLLRIEVEGVADSIRTDFLGIDRYLVSNRAEQLSRIGSAVRQTPTFESTLGPPTLDEISQAVQPGCPLVYMGAAPEASFAVMMDKDESGELELAAIRTEDCNSNTLAELVLFGRSPLSDEGTMSPYLIARAESERIDESILALCPLVGEHLLRPLSEWLVGRGASSVTIVPTGLFGLTPLHAIAWSDAAGSWKMLIDDFDIKFTYSARLMIACKQRSLLRVTDVTRFIGVANPLPHSRPLPGAKFETEIVRRLVAVDDATILYGEQATKEEVMDALPFATYVHLACHAGAQFFGQPWSAAVSLAGDRQLSAIEVARLEIPARLVVASACQTGIIQGYDELDESFSLAAAFIAAGAAGVVASLWAVDDYATALLMSKFYEGIFLEGKAPAAALRQAQLWMRSTEQDTIDAYVSSREPLRALRDSKQTSVTSTDQISVASDEMVPFRAPSYWAAFFIAGT